mmetsp:Transcript_4362/g.10886  ORF Transcript_4362/g.10886 Transcript_4362/m.10886 type:complete len:259 (-) Transcript_4362:259-1035(-)
MLLLHVLLQLLRRRLRQPEAEGGARAREQHARRVDLERAHRPGVPLQRGQRLARRRAPAPDGAILAAGEHVLGVGAEARLERQLPRVVVAGEDALQGPREGVEQQHPALRRAQQHQLAVVRELDRGEVDRPAHVGRERGERALLVRAHVVHLRLAAAARGCEHHALQVKGDGGAPAAGEADHAGAVGGAQVPQPDGVVSRGRGEGVLLGRHLERDHAVGVPLEEAQVPVVVQREVADAVVEVVPRGGDDGVRVVREPR